MSAWRDRSLAAGHEPATVIANATGHESAVISADRLTVEVRQQLADWVLSDTSARRSTFSRANLLASAQRITRLVRFTNVSERLAMDDELVDTAVNIAESLTPQRYTIGPETTADAVAIRCRSVCDHQDTVGVYITVAITDQEEFV